MGIGLCATLVLKGCSIRTIVSGVPLLYSIVAVVNRARVDVGLSVGISVTVSVPSNKVRVVVVFTKKCCLGSQSCLVGCQASRNLVVLVLSKLL